MRSPQSKLPAGILPKLRLAPLWEWCGSPKLTILLTMNLLTGKASAPPPRLYYVAVGLAKADGKLYKKRGWAVKKVQAEEAKGNIAQIWEVPTLGWIDVTSVHSDPQLLQQGRARQAWGTQGGSVRKTLLSSSASAVDFVRAHPRLESAVDWIDKGLARFGRR